MAHKNWLRVNTFLSKSWQISWAPPEDSGRAQLHLALFDPWELCPPGSSVHGILLASILEWVAISFSRGSSQPRSPALQVDSLPGEPQGKPHEDKTQANFHFPVYRITWHYHTWPLGGALEPLRSMFLWLLPRRMKWRCKTKKQVIGA